MADDPLTRIRDLADELTDSRQHREPYTVWTGQRHRVTHHHVTVQHGLLRQLHDAALIPTVAAGDEGSAGVPASRPPLEVEALSRHDQITAAARTWSFTLGTAPRPTVESTIRGLVSAAPAANDHDQRQLLADLRRWTSWCRVYLGLEHVRRIPGARCPIANCNALGTLRINLTTSHALCTVCGATWNHESIGVLAEHIRASRTTAQMGA